MIGTPPDKIQNRDTDISFFEALAHIVQESGLSYAEIARRANKPVKEAIAKIPDPAERIFAEMATHYLHRATVYRAVRGITSISKDVLSLIAAALNLDDDTLQWLEALRKEEEYVHHSTQQRAIAIKTNKDTDQLPSWCYSQ